MTSGGLSPRTRAALAVARRVGHYAPDAAPPKRLFR